MKPVKVRILKETYDNLMNETIQSTYSAYHGSETSIEKFVDSFVGGGDAIDQEGAGIYFTTDENQARTYGNHIYSVELWGNFLTDTNPPENINYITVQNLIQLAPNWKNISQNFDDDPQVGSSIAAKDAIMYSESEKEVFQTIEADFYGVNPVEYVRNMVKLGYDGILVNIQGDDNHKNIIMFNPNNIKFTGKEI